MSENKIDSEVTIIDKYKKNVPWYLISSLITKAASFLLIPVYAHYLTPEGYGALSNIESASRIFAICISLYMDAAFTRYYFEERTSGLSSIRRLFSTHFWFILAWGSVSAIGLFYLAGFLFDGLVDVASLILIIIILSQLFNQLAIMVAAVWKAELLAKKLAVVQIIVSFLTTFATFYLIVFNELDWDGRIYALGIASVAQFAFLFFVAVKSGWVGLVFDLDMVKRSLKYSVPLVPNVAAGWIAGFSDRIVLAYYGRLDEAGIYSIAVQLGYLVYLFSDAIGQVQSPLAMSGLTSDRKAELKRMSNYLIVFIILMLVPYVSISIFTPEIVDLFLTGEYSPVMFLVPILALIYIVGGVYRVFTVILSFYGKMLYVSLAAFVQASVNFAANMIFVPFFGMYSASFSSLISMFFYCGFIVYFAQKFDRIEIYYKEIIYVSSAALFVVVMSLLVESYVESWGYSFLIKLMMLLILLVFLLYRPSLKSFRDKLFKFCLRSGM